jgi:hypothetical protein
MDHRIDYDEVGHACTDQWIFEFLQRVLTKHWIELAWRWTLQNLYLRITSKYLLWLNYEIICGSNIGVLLSDVWMDHKIEYDKVWHACTDRWKFEFLQRVLTKHWIELAWSRTLQKLYLRITSRNLQWFEIASHCKIGAFLSDVWMDHRLDYDEVRHACIDRWKFEFSQRV